MQDLLTLIKTRQSTRTAFDPDKAIPKNELAQIAEAGGWAPTAHNMQNFELVVVDDKALIEKICAIKLSTSEIFIRENYAQLSFSEDELRKRRTGVLGSMFPKSWLTPPFVAREDDEEPRHGLAERHNQLLSCSALFIMVYDPRHRAPASEGDFFGIMSLGCVLENMWLMAASLGIGLHVVSSLSEEKAADELKGLLHIPAQLRIAISFRLGYPIAATQYLRVRRDLSSFVHHNDFGHKGL